LKKVFIILISSFLLISCGTYKFHTTSDFSIITDTNDFEGNYLNRESERSLLSLFNINDYANFVSITSHNQNEIKLTYYSDSGEQEHIFKGKMKDNFFEIYFSKKQIIIPLIYSSVNVQRVRIGKSEDGKLLIRSFVDQSGNLLFLAGGRSGETPYLFLNANDFEGYIPYRENGLWGYSDALGNKIIPAKYDFAGIFEQGIAHVKLNDKWGLINEKGEEITPIKYDNISFIDTKFYPPIFRATIGDKVGALDLAGNETIPVVYDFLAYSNMSHYGLFSIRLGDKLGYANRTEVVIPAIYSRIINFDGETAIAIRDGEYYIVDKCGYEYESKGIGLLREAIPETKRKIQFEEQNLN